jgi:hypothetical protein
MEEMEKNKIGIVSQVFLEFLSAIFVGGAVADANVFIRIAQHKEYSVLTHKRSKLLP